MFGVSFFGGGVGEEGNSFTVAWLMRRCVMMVEGSLLGSSAPQRCLLSDTRQSTASINIIPGEIKNGKVEFGAAR